MSRAAGPAGEDDDRDLGPAAQPVDDLDAVHVGQAEVKDDQVRGDFAASRRAVVPSAATVDVVAAGAQVDAHRPQDLGVVVDDQDAGHGAAPRREAARQVSTRLAAAGWAVGSSATAAGARGAGWPRVAGALPGGRVPE